MPAKTIAHEFVEYAFLSVVAYDAPGTEQRQATTDILKSKGWSQWPTLPTIVKQPDERKEVAGLAYKIWEKAETHQVAIVFCGSNGREDWYSNFRWVTRYIPGYKDHYLQVQEITPQLVKAIDERPAVRPWNIVTTGHSLGGGLAQQAAYISHRIKQVYAFDSSPVTGFYSVSDPPRKQNAEGVVISRIYEKGEALSFVRSGMRLIHPLSLQNPAVSEVRFNFIEKKDPVAEHSMRELAANLQKASPTPMPRS